MVGFGLRGQDSWRTHPTLSNLHKGKFPGMKYAVLFVGTYIAFDKLTNANHEVVLPKAVSFSADPEGQGMPHATVQTAMKH
mmetsp:Transcript_2852/g.4281  ORF Transcript_2852/g.4281 Transcript_2852/m.4281 type:complete len:81 (-) Transcript_2852:35-277(-)